MIFRIEKLIQVDRNQNSGYFWLWGCLGRNMKEFSGMIEMFCILQGLVYLDICIWQNH